MEFQGVCMNLAWNGFGTCWWNRDKYNELLANLRDLVPGTRFKDKCSLLEMTITFTRQQLQDVCIHWLSQSMTGLRALTFGAVTVVAYLSRSICKFQVEILTKRLTAPLEIPGDVR